MNIRPKTMRRLMILFAGVFVAVALLSGLIALSVHRNNAALRKLRAEAMAAYNAGDYAKAARLLAAYRKNAASHDPDPDAEFAFGKSEGNLEMPDGQHVIEGIHTFEQYLQKLRPGDVEAQHELLKLYLRAGYNAEALRLADEVLAKNPRDTDVLEQKVIAFNNQHKLDLALAASRKLNEIAPLNLKGQIITIYLMTETQAPAETVIGHAQALQKAHEKDPRFEVLLAYAYSRTHNEAEAAKWLRSAAGRAPPDAAFVVELASRLDMAGLFSDTEAFIARAAQTIGAPVVQHLLAQRLWEQQKVTELQERFKNVAPSNPNSDGVLIGYRAIAMYADGKASEAAALVEALSHRQDVASAAWAMGLKARHAMPPLSPTELITNLQAAASRDPQNAVLHMMLADAYLRIHEPDLAIHQAAQASLLAPSWAVPYLVTAEALTTSGRQADAMATVREAVKRAPNRYETETMLAKVNFAWVSESGLAADYGSLLGLLEGIQQTWHDPQTLPLYVAVLSRTGKREQAAKTAADALKLSPPLSSGVLMDLASAVASEKLEVGQDILQYVRENHGLTPELALTQARLLMQAGKPADGLQLLLDAYKGHEKQVPWRVALAVYREAIRSDQALRDWISLGDQYPNDLPLQQSILSAASRFGDRAFWGRTVARVKALTGDHGLLRRVERGRWLLDGELTEKEKAEAVNLLTEVTRTAPGLPEPHLLLARAMEKVKNTQGAMKELSAAADARPGDPAITGELVRLLLAANKNAEALAYLNKMANTRGLSPAARNWLARVYREQGYADKALSVLAADESTDHSVEQDRMLAGLYRENGRGDDAAKLYKSLLNKPITDPVFWAEGADFFASRQDLYTAQQFMGRVAQLALPAGEAQIIAARFAQRWMGSEEALKRYQAAAHDAPQSAHAWAALAAFHLQQHHFADAATASSDGLKYVSGSALLKAIHANAIALATLGNIDDLQALIEGACVNPQDPAVAEMLAVVADAQTRNLSKDAAAQKIKEVADRHPQNLAMQSQAVHSYVILGQTEMASDIARRAAQANPGSGEPQRLLANVYAIAGHWKKAEEAALLWRQRSPDQVMSADLGLAEIYLRQPQKNSAAALRVLAPYIPATPNGVIPNARALDLHVKALAAQGRMDEAAQWLKPLIASSPRWREQWLEMASACNDAAAASQWIEQILPMIPADAPKERCLLAGAWYGIGMKFDFAPALANAEQLLGPLLTESPDALQAWVLAALTAQAQGNYPVAEREYRHVLRLAPTLPDALNNMAYFLWLRGNRDDMAEAKKLSEAAIAARPHDASFDDTLARIQDRAGDRKGAIETFRRARLKDPASLEVMIGLADLLSREPSTRQEARELIVQIQTMIAGNITLPANLRKQYQTARDAVASSL